MCVVMSASYAYSQTAEGRTPRTKISDGLALLPAPDNKEYVRIMKDFISTGDEGMDMLTSMFNSTNNVQVSYALGGLAAFVSDGDPAARKMFNRAIERALKSDVDDEIKAFYIRLLQTSGDDQSVGVLASFIPDQRLGGPAINAIKSIGTPAAIGVIPATAEVKAAKVKLTPIEKLAKETGIKGKAAMPQVLKALGSKDRAYRCAALYLTEPFIDSEILGMVAAALPRLSVQAKSDVIDYLGRHEYRAALPAIIQYIGNPDEELSETAMWAATRIGGGGVPEALLTVVKDSGSSPAMRSAAISCLASYKGDVGDQLEFAAEQGDPAGKAAALELIGSKRMARKVQVVMSATSDSDKAVASAAYAALEGVVGYNQFFALCQMLEGATDPEVISMLQKAVTASLSGLPAQRQLDDIKEKMSASRDRSLYYIPLAATGALEALDIISDGYTGGSAVEKERALAALTSWRGGEAVDRLYEIARDGGPLSGRALAALVDRVSRSAMTPEMKTVNYSDALVIATDNPLKVRIIKELAKANCFQALMLAGGYLDEADGELRQAAVDAVRNIALANKSYYGPVVVALLEKAARLNTSADSSYQREEIRKHIASLPAQGGYVSMFNGKDYSGWKGLVENPITRAKMSSVELEKKQVAADEAMRRDWKIRDGMIVFEGKGYDNICTAREYGDFEMYIDWMLYAEGTEADGGIYLRGTPQVQMWDTSRRNVGAQVGSGGLYNNSVNPSKPSEVADNTLGRWNTFYIKMAGERVTVVLNGRTVVDNVILENFWDRKTPIFPVGQIELQAHGTRVAYRNMFINELERPEPYELSAEEEKEGFRVLFDGTTMNDWTGNKQDYVTQDGTITLYPSNGHGGNLYTKDEFADFVFRFDFRLTPGANNGLGIRTPMEGDAAYVGMELQILDDTAPIYAMLAPYQYHGSVYGVIPAIKGALKPMGEWNSQEVRIKGYDIKITLNGVVIVDGNLAQASNNGTATKDGQKHPGLLNTKGHIGFLGHGSEVSFRNIRIKEL